MSLATQFDTPQFDTLPVPRRPAAPAAESLATVIELRPPSDRGAVPLRLTRRGVTVLAVLVAALAAGLVALAAVSAPGPSAASRVHPPATVLVRSGDTLWSIAGRVAPGRDPRAEVDELTRRNHLSSPTLVPGQVLRTR